MSLFFAATVKLNFRNLFWAIHKRISYNRRLDVLVERIIPLLHDSDTILDIGCGNGLFLKAIASHLTESQQSRGVDIKIREEESTEGIDIFDGYILPYADSSFDACMFIDVLHHVWHIRELMLEAMRVSSEYIVIKDHLYYSILDHMKLSFMDYVGNRAYGTKVIYNFKNEIYWLKLFDSLGLDVVLFEYQVPIHQFPVTIFFDNRLQCIIKLRIRDKHPGKAKDPASS